MKNCLIVCLSMTLLAAPLLQADTPSSAVNEKPLVATSLQSFNEASANIRKQMQTGGVYEHITAVDRGRVEARLADMQKILQNHASDSDLKPNEKVALVNAQEEVNGILRHNDDNRLVCEHKAPVGSHLPVTTCITYAEMMARHRSDQKDLIDAQREQPTRSGGN